MDKDYKFERDEYNDKNCEVCDGKECIRESTDILKECDSSDEKSDTVGDIFSETAGDILKIALGEPLGELGKRMIAKVFEHNESELGNEEVMAEYKGTDESYDKKLEIKVDIKETTVIKK